MVNFKKTRTAIAEALGGGKRNKIKDTLAKYATGAWTEKRAKEYARDLNKLDILYHIDDDAVDIEWNGAKDKPDSADETMLNKISDAIHAARQTEAYFSEGLRLIK